MPRRGSGQSLADGVGLGWDRYGSICMDAVLGGLKRLSNKSWFSEMADTVAVLSGAVVLL